MLYPGPIKTNGYFLKQFKLDRNEKKVRHLLTKTLLYKNYTKNSRTKDNFCSGLDFKFLVRIQLFSNKISELIEKKLGKSAEKFKTDRFPAPAVVVGVH